MGAAEFVGIFIFCVVCVILCFGLLKFVRGANRSVENRSSKKLQPENLPPTGAEQPDVGGSIYRAEPFGYKMSWIAIRFEDGNSISETLGLRNVQRIGWVDGVAAAYVGGLFVTPSVGGFTFVVGPEASLGSAQLIGDRLGCEVQVFESYRNSDNVIWERFQKESGLRSFRFSDGEFVNVGELTDVEKKIGLEEFVSVWGSDVDELPDDLFMPSEESVLQVAASWGIDPSTFSDPDDRLGWLMENGSIPKSLQR
jgi:hypothetical protein